MSVIDQCMKSLIIEKVKRTTDNDLLDLIYKLLLYKS